MDYNFLGSKVFDVQRCRYRLGFFVKNTSSPGIFVEICIFTLTVVVYLLIIFKACDGDRWTGRQKEKKKESDWLDRLFGQIKRRSICSKISFNGIVVIMAICIVVEACLLIRVNFTRLESQHLSYHVDTEEISDKY